MQNNGHLFALLLAAVAFFALWVIDDEAEREAFEQQEYCARVAAHQADATLGHTDYKGICGGSNEH